MIIMVVRIAFFGAILGAALTGSPALAAASLLPAAILLFTDGWQAILAYGAAAIVLLLLVGVIATIF